MQKIHQILPDHPGAAIVDLVSLFGLLFVAVLGGYVGVQAENINSEYNMTASLEADMKSVCEVFAAKASCND